MHFTRTLIQGESKPVHFRIAMYLCFLIVNVFQTIDEKMLLYVNHFPPSNLIGREVNVYHSVMFTIDMER